jgi:hypothetical protein
MSIEVLIVDVAEDFSPAIKKSCQWFWQSRIAGKFSIASLRYQGGGRVRLRIRSSGKHLREPHGAQQIPPLRCAPVGMTRGEGWLRSELRVGRGETADPSTALRSGRDDKGRGVAQVRAESGKARNSRSLHFGRDDKGRGVA